jgi:3-carboxy-cis,cis-muconate cycloisomerase
MGLHTHGVLFRDVFGTERMRAIFDEPAFVATFLEVEAALARAEADVGVVPEWAAAEITAKASLDHLDMDRVAANVAEMGLFSMSVVEAWKAELGEAGEYVHWGASTQDVSDTVLVLQLREALSVLGETLLGIRDRLADLARTHRKTPMVGRTQHVNAPPITFGYKVATWLDEVERHLLRLRELESRLYVVEFAGATGTLAALGDDGIDVLERFAAELDLDAPAVGWTATRDRFAETLQWFALVAGTLARIARQVLLLNRPEFGELTETVPDDELGSSTNPHKRNPVLSQHAVGLARLIRGHAGVLQESLESLDERDRSAWYVEFAVVPEAAGFLHRMLEDTLTNLEGLEVDPAAMERNLERSGSLIASEAVMIALAESVGRQTAHDVVHEDAMTALESDRTFREVLAADPRVTEHLDEAALDELTDPSAYTGLAAQFVDRVLAASDATADGA